MSEPTATAELVCKRPGCGHVWVPRVPHPKVCPKCKSYDWDKSPQEVDNEVSSSAIPAINK